MKYLIKFRYSHTQQTPKPSAHEPELVPPLSLHSALKLNVKCATRCLNYALVLIDIFKWSFKMNRSCITLCSKYRFVSLFRYTHHSEISQFGKSRLMVYKNKVIKCFIQKCDITKMYNNVANCLSYSIFHLYYQRLLRYIL